MGVSSPSSEDPCTDVGNEPIADSEGGVGGRDGDGAAELTGGEDDGGGDDGGGDDGGRGKRGGRTKWLGGKYMFCRVFSSRF